MAHFERSNLTKLAEAMAKRIDRMAAGDCQKVGAIGSVGLVSAVDCGSQFGAQAIIVAESTRPTYPSAMRSFV